MSAPIRACWQPASALPKVDQPTSIVVAFPPNPEDDSDTTWYLGGAIYIVSPDGRVASEHTDVPIQSSEWWWCEEDALLAGLPI